MTTFKITYATGKEETFTFDGTREEYIAEEFGEGGLNPLWATLETVDAAAVENTPEPSDAPVAKKKAKKADDEPAE